MNFCSNCGQQVVLRIPPGDHLPRYVCDACHTTHYQNPKVVAGCIPEWEGKILLCKRGIEPRLGLWTVPAGFMENGETTEEAAARETLEETLAEVRVEALFSLYSIPHISQVYMLYRGSLVNDDFGATPESTEVALFEPAEIPWEQLAFPVVRSTLQHYIADLDAGLFNLHTGKIERRTR